LWNATNGYPLFVFELLNNVPEDALADCITHEHIVGACSLARPALQGALEALWTECSPSCRDLFRHLAAEKVIARTGVAQLDADMLVERGFARQTGNKLQRPNRLLCEHLSEQPNEGNALQLLFGNNDAYEKNFRTVMEHRIADLSGLDPQLRRYLELNAADLPTDPSRFLLNIRGIVNRAFELIWSAELSERRIPSEWTAIWKYYQERGVNEWETKFPQGVHRVRLLNLMTGTERSNPCAKFVSKTTYVLMNAVHGFGDFGQHSEGVVIGAGFAYSALLLCIELAASLARELKA
jgi:hypothetical protein